LTLFSSHRNKYLTTSHLINNMALVLGLMVAWGGSAKDQSGSCNATLRSNWDVGLNPLGSMLSTPSGVSSCCDACVSNRSCVTFVFRGPANCYLKADALAGKAKGDNVAGFVRALAPSPPPSPSPSPPQPPTPPPPPPPKGAPKFVLARALDHPVINALMGKAHNINSGFEGKLRGRNGNAHPSAEATIGLLKLCVVMV
jgi:hypothetical protein